MNEISTIYIKLKVIDFMTEIGLCLVLLLFFGIFYCIIWFVMEIKERWEKRRR